MSSPALALRAAAAHSRRKQVRWIVALFVLVNALLVVSPASFAAAAVFPALSLLVAGFVYARSRPAYVGFVCWLWFLTPLVRRLVDFRAPSAPTKLILLAPFAAAVVPLFSLIAKKSALVNRRTAPLLYVAGAILYGMVVGLSGFKFSTVGQSLVAWAVPLILPFFLVQHRDELTSLYASFERAFLGGVLVTGLYGIYQFVFVPPWDVLWMQNSDLTSIGQPEPYLVRVFSTMNAPQVFGAFMMCGLLIVMRSQSKLRFVVAPIGLLALVLSMSRAAWLGLAIGAIYLLFTMTRKQRVRLAFVGALSLLLALAAVQIPEVNTVVMDRVSSLTQPEEDSSYQSRRMSLNQTIQDIRETPFGFGFSPQQHDSPQSGSFGSEERDSSPIAVLISTGWLGALLFAIAILLLIPRVFSRGGSLVAAVGASRAVVIALAAEALLNNIFSGPVAFLTWAAVGFCLAASQRGALAASRPATSGHLRLESTSSILSAH
jgi:hypothetical protein